MRVLPCPDATADESRVTCKPSIHAEHTEPAVQGCSCARAAWGCHRGLLVPLYIGFAGVGGGRGARAGRAVDHDRLRDLCVELRGAHGDGAPPACRLLVAASCPLASGPDRCGVRCAQAVTNAYMGKQQFYPTVIYLVTSKTNMVVSY